jgi:hypothetical protein
MKNMRRFAQTATEYLIILAVVIIIALIVVGVLGGIPGIGGSASTQALSAYWSTSKIGVNSIAIAASTNSANNDTIVLRNNLPYTITITGVSVGASTTAQTSLNITSQIVPAGTAVTISRLAISGVLSDFYTCSAGTTYALNVFINYTEGLTNAQQTFSGDGNKLQGTCAN